MGTVVDRSKRLEIRWGDEEGAIIKEREKEKMDRTDSLVSVMASRQMVVSVTVTGWVCKWSRRVACRT